VSDIVKAGGALAIRPDQTSWTEEQALVLRQSGISDQVTKAELSGFLHLCQRTQLDPFSRQIYLIGRFDRRAGREVFTPQTAIDGYRVVAHRVIAASGDTFGYEDTLWCDKDGQWRDAWLPEEPPAAAKVTVLRNGQRFSAVALFREYVQTGKEGKRLGLWGKMPAGQVAKCAEALALRKAFPHDLAGVYTAEEMAQADNPAPAAERHLRRVQPGESDQWATPAATVAAATADVPAESLTPSGRDYLHEAHAAPDAATVRLIWQDAKAEGARPGYLAQIGEVGKTKAAAEQPQDDGVVDVEVVETGSTPHSYADAVAAEPSVTTEAEAAERELRAAAANAGLTNLDEEFERSYGLPIKEAGAQQMREMKALLTGTAA
jgi:phage recombination protein Bet